MSATHEYRCEGPKEAPHPEETRFVITRFGDSPPRQDCPVCGIRMAKRFGKVGVIWSPRWEHLHK